MKVLLFGRYADLAGWRERELSPPAGSVEGIIDILAGETPELAGELGARWTFITRNRDQIRGDAPLSADDEIAFMPPMSGG